jgi:hypothetical protein
LSRAFAFATLALATLALATLALATIAFATLALAPIPVATLALVIALDDLWDLREIKGAVEHLNTFVIIGNNGQRAGSWRGGDLNRLREIRFPTEVKIVAFLTSLRRCDALNRLENEPLE